jgi:hypothetical protein
VVGPEQRRKFSVDMSKFEYCQGKVERELDSFSIFVYTPEMIVIEKLRAICQQMPEYGLRSRPSARARDFYDIWRVVSAAKLDLATAENAALARQIFAAKLVPLALLERVELQREFHRPDWPAVTAAVSGSLQDFDYYFDFVVERVMALKASWII